jgi:tRNA threonylcarbamoyl adenosine modification protein YeaZ
VSATGRAATAAHVLAIDTATTRCVVALGALDGTLIAETVWAPGYRHGETLLPAVERTLAEAGLGRADLAALVVGTGPGAFTGLRVGIAAAKGIAHGLGAPLLGVGTGQALLSSAAALDRLPLDRHVLLLPAGAKDRVLVTPHGESRLIPGGTDPDLGADVVLVALDLDGRAPAEALERGESARERLGAELVRLGSARLAARSAGADGTAATGDPLAELVPEYVTLPRGVRESSGEVAWSRDPR